MLSYEFSHINVKSGQWDGLRYVKSVPKGLRQRNLFHPITLTKTFILIPILIWFPEHEALRQKRVPKGVKFAILETEDIRLSKLVSE